MESEARMEENRTPLGPLTLSQQNGEIPASLDFSKLTPSQFGITSESFTSFSRDKDKSRVAQLKARRRSTIGVRGSPETNSLICFRAKQAMKTPPRTPQHLLESPLFSGRDSIKQKMAAFQRLMGAEEEEEDAEHSQSGVDGGSEERDNRPAAVTPPLSKRRRRGTPHRGPGEETIEEEPQVDSSEFRSPVMAPSLGLDSQSQLMSLPMLSKPQTIKSGEDEFFSVSTKKRVRFGVPLSPEFFDKTLPPCTPLQKGATPALPPSSTGRKQSLLKTPQRFEPPLPQPDFSSPERTGASPVLPALTRHDLGADCDEVFLDNQKISFPIMDEEYDNPPQDTKGLEPPGEHAEITGAASQEEEETSPSLTPAPHPPAAEPDELQPPNGVEPPAEAPRSRGRKRKQPPDSETTETRRSSRSAAESAKGKLKTSSAKRRFGTKDVDRSLYGKRDYASKNPLLSPIPESAASSLISTPTRACAADENPSSFAVPALDSNLSKAAPPDVTANLVVAAALWRRRFLHEAKKDKDSNTKPTDSSVQSASPESSVMSPRKRARSSMSAVRASRGRRNSASRSRRSEPAVGAQKPEVCPPEAQESNQEKKPAGETSATEKLNQLKSVIGRRSTRKKSSSVSEEEEQKKAEKVCKDMLESSGSEKEEVEKNKEEVRQNSGLHEEVKKEEVVVRQNSELHEEVEKNDEEVRQTQKHEELMKNDEDSTPPPLPSETLESWQQPDFCIDDVLKSVAKTRGSVRRSLRHRRSMDVLAKGLAWVEHTSPQTITQTQRRRTRGRLSAVSRPPSLPESEETLRERALTATQL